MRKTIQYTILQFRYLLFQNWRCIRTHKCELFVTGGDFGLLPRLWAVEAVTFAVVETVLAIDSKMDGTYTVLKTACVPLICRLFRYLTRSLDQAFRLLGSETITEDSFLRLDGTISRNEKRCVRFGTPRPAGISMQNWRRSATQFSLTGENDAAGHRKAQMRLPLLLSGLILASFLCEIL